jgi:hypothetical protein
MFGGGARAFVCEPRIRNSAFVQILGMGRRS